MQTISHVVVNSALAIHLFPNQAFFQAVFVAGGVLPDLAFGLRMLHCKRNKRNVMDEYDGTQWDVQASHSLPVIISLIFVSVFWIKYAPAQMTDFGRTALTLILGVLLHVIIDILTHGSKPLEDGKKAINADYMWPLTPLKCLDGRYAPLEYRKGHTDLSFKSWELCTNIFLIIIGIIGLMR